MVASTLTRSLRVILATITAIAGVLISTAVLSVVSASVASASVTWGSVIGLRGGTYDFQGQLYSVSCTALGDCTAVGYNGWPIYATETGGLWGPVADAPGLIVGGSFQGVSCIAAGVCTAVGYDLGKQRQPIYATETGGVWGPVTEVPGSGGGDGSFWGVSCTADGSCTAVGQDINYKPIYASETGGVWSPATEVTGSGENIFYSVSCTGAGTCTAVGEGTLGAIYATETGGVWGPITAVPASGNGPIRFSSVSCIGVGACTAVGADGTGNGQPIYVTETGGIWGVPAEVLGSAGGAGYFESVSCIAAGVCTAVGTDNNPAPIIASETGEVWSPVTEAPFSGLGGVSCVNPGNCTAVGDNTNQPSVGWTLAPPTMPTITNLPSSGSFPGGFTATIATTGDGTETLTSSTASVCITESALFVSYVGLGTCRLTAHVTQGATYAAADGTPQSFVVTDFSISVASLPSAVPGTPYGPVTLQATDLDPSTLPYVTTVKWTKQAVVLPATALPKGMTLSSAGILAGTPSVTLTAGWKYIKVKATESVTKVAGVTKHVMKITALATIPIYIN